MSTRWSGLRHRCGAGLLCGAFVVPLTSQDGWEALKFRGIEQNEVRFDAAGLTIDVDGSAGPLVYPLTAPLTVTRVRARGMVSGQLALGDPARQGAPGQDDYVVRIGLVETGDRRLGRFARLTSPG